MLHPHGLKVTKTWVFPCFDWIVHKRSVFSFWRQPSLVYARDSVALLSFHVDFAIRLFCTTLHSTEHNKIVCDYYDEIRDSSLYYVLCTMYVSSDCLYQLVRGVLVSSRLVIAEIVASTLMSPTEDGDDILMYVWRSSFS